MKTESPEWLKTLSDEPTQLQVKLVKHPDQYVIDVRICGYLIATHTEKVESAARQMLSACFTTWHTRLNAIATSSFLRGHSVGYARACADAKNKESTP